MPTRFSSITARVVGPPDSPLPLWTLYPIIFVGIYLSHYALLRLPYFWDEAGYYIPAALDFFRTGSLIPHSTLTNAHPPLPSIFLAAWWRFGGFTIESTRTLIELVAAAALLGVYRLGRLLAGDTVAAAATLLTALYPIWFTQSTLAHADIFAAAFTLWGLSFYLQRNNANAVAILFSLAALSKETAIVTPVALAAWDLAQRTPLFTRARQQQTFSRANLIALCFPVVPLVAWYAYHRHVTGFTFGNPEFLRYNATANLSAGRIFVSLWHRITHLTVHMGMYAPIVCTLAVLPMPRRNGDRARLLTTPILCTLAVIVAANAVAFSILGGALLTRYLLPLYPLILLACVALWIDRMRSWPLLATLSAAAFVAALFINPPYSIAPEDNLTYRDFVTLHQRAATIVARDFPDARVLTAWPGNAELNYPDLGYVRQPIKTVPIDNFSASEIAKAAQSPGSYDTAFVFSTKWIPPPGTFSLTRHTERTDTQFYDFHRDLSPKQVALALRGQVIWQAQSHGEWAAILRFPRIREANLAMPGAERLPAYAVPADRR